MRNTNLYVLIIASCTGVVACDSGHDEDELVDEAGFAAMSPDCDPDALSGGPQRACIAARLKEGKRLFFEETFGGNGRTCSTCHGKDTGTFTPEEAQARLAADPNDPLFVHDGLDDGMSGTTRITTHATVRYEIPLPPMITLADDPTATSVVLNRGTPTTMNTPALDPVLMYDGRQPDLQSQALGAIHDHAENTIEPTANQLELIAEFQQSDPHFFSSDALFEFAKGGPPPQLPAGTTDSEQRGRAMFDDVPFDPVTKAGICAICHSGPMLNSFNAFNPFGAPPGGRFFTNFASVRNTPNNPVHTFLVDEGNGFIAEVTTADPGVILTDPLPPEFPPFLPRSFFANNFKIPTVWGVTQTAPYFHNNGAKTLEEVADHYNFFFTVGFGFSLSAQDQADIVAFLLLL